MPVPEHVARYRKIYDDWRGSGLSIAKYCEKNDYTTTSFNRWGQQIYVHDLESKEQSKFIEIDFTNELALNHDADEIKSNDFTIFFGDSVRIEVNRDCDRFRLENLLSALGKVC
jgi:hypothetical protein